MRSHFTITIENRHAAFIRGRGARELLTELRGRPPLYSATARAWATTEPTALDFAALAEHRGHSVTVESYVVVRTWQ